MYNTSTMGLKESLPQRLHVPETERTENITSALTEDFTNILIGGCVVTPTGTVIIQPAEPIINNLPQALKEATATERVLKLRRANLREPLSQEMEAATIGSTRLYLITPNAIDGLSYNLLKGGSLIPVLINRDGTTIRSHSTHDHFISFFRNRVNRILKHEGIEGSPYRFATTILKELADTQGLGNLRGEKAQDYIKAHSESVK